MLAFPLLVLPVILYNVLAAFMEEPWPAEIVGWTMLSGARFSMSLGDLVIAIALVLLFVEILKATRTGRSSIVDHALSMAVFIVCLVEFLSVGFAATSVFFLLTCIALIDVVAGYSVSISAARRDFGIDQYPGT